MSDSETVIRGINKTNDLVLVESLREKVEELPWRQRKVPFSLLNPCTKPFEEIGKLMVDLYDKGKIKKIVIEHGTGEAIPYDASVYLHYTCYAEGQKFPFDTSLIRSLTPKHYQMGGGYLFSGFEVAVGSMSENEIAQFLIHPDYAFGKFGCPPRIPANAHIMIVIQVTGLIDCGHVTLRNWHTEIEFCTFTEKLNTAKSHKALGIDYYKHGRIKMAFHHFREAQYTLDEIADTKEDEAARQAFLHKSFLNQMMCLCHDKYLKPKKLIEVAERAMKDIPDLVQKDGKFYYCLGVAYTHLQDYNEAAESLIKAQSLSPFLPRLSAALKFLHENAEKAFREEKFMWRGAFNKLGYSPMADKIESESEPMSQMRKCVHEMLTNYLQSGEFVNLNLGFGYNKMERNILAIEARNLGLICEQYMENNQIWIEIRKGK